MRKSIYLLLLLLLAPNALFPENPSDNPRYRYTTPTVTDTFPAIFDMIGMVDTVMITAHVIHMQQFVTRFCTQQGSFDAQDWIKGQFEYYGLPVELQDFDCWLGPSSDNVIATLQGDVHPDEYVIMGAHYDSYATITDAPGADDNASGTCGVIEAAKILSQYHFEKSIIFCAFSAEEMGLIGSEAYAARCEQDGMIIPGYFNMDMIGYQEPGTLEHTDIIAPPFSQPLVDFYKETTAIYLPGFPADEGYLTGGDSDHTSFNNHGYMGIFPFEDDTDYSHYIHTSDDVVGLSYNSALLAMRLTQAAIAAVATMAVPVDNTGINPASEKGATARLYPNPANGHVTIEASAGIPVVARVLSLTGENLVSKSFSGSVNLDISSLPPGMYILELTGEGYHCNKKLVVR